VAAVVETMARVMVEATAEVAAVEVGWAAAAWVVAEKAVEKGGVVQWVEGAMAGEAAGGEAPAKVEAVVMVLATAAGAEIRRPARPGLRC